MPDGTMTPENQKPQEFKILIADKSGNEVKRAPQTIREFNDVQQYLYDLIKNPNSKIETELRMERARLISEAKEVGVFTSLKNKFLDIQTSNSFIDSATQINSINTGRLEQEARGLSGWKNNFEGMLEQYKQGALRNMEMALLQASGQGGGVRAKQLAREIELLNWGTPPSIIDSLAQNPNGKDVAKIPAQVIDENKLAQQIAEAQGLLAPQDYLRQYVTAEDFVSAPIQIVPGAEPRFWPVLNEKERQEWYVRSTLITAAYKKKTAGSTDKLYMAEMNEFAVDLNKKAIQTIFAKAGVLPAVSVYTTLIGDSEFYEEKKHPKDVLLDLSSEDISSLKKNYGEEVVAKLIEEKNVLEKDFPKSIFTKEEQGFRKIRDAIRFWLITKGRNFLLEDDELTNKEKFFENKKKSVEILKSRARDAEQIGWNFVFLTSLIEHFDSREYRPEGSKRIGPHSYWNLFQWMVMHPQERFEQKIIRYEDGEPQAKEEWAALGTWALKNANSGNWTVVENGKRKVKFPKILPDTIIYSALHPAKFTEKKVANEGIGFDVLNNLGRRVLFETKKVDKKKISDTIKWDDDENPVSDAPFVPFIFDEMRWADVVFQVFKKGANSKIGLEDFGEAVRNLRLDTKTRENLLIAYYGANPSSSELKPKMGKLNWIANNISLKEYYPNLFLKK